MEPILLASNNVNTNELMWTVTASGILVVFGVLILLVAIFYLFGAIMRKGSNKGKKAPSAKAEKIVKSAPAPAPAAKPAPVVEQGISPEIVAAISAAIAYSEGGAQYTIKSIRRQQRTSGRPAWAMAGIADNTRPF